MSAELLHLAFAFGAFALLTYVVLCRPKGLIQIKKRFANGGAMSLITSPSKVDGSNKGRKWGSKIDIA